MSNKALHIIDNLGLGGAQSVVKGIAEYADADYQHHVFALRLRDRNIKIDCQYVHIYRSGRKLSLRPIRSLAKYIRHHNIEVIQCHLFRSVVFGILLKMLFIPGIRLIVHEHGHIFRSDRLYPRMLRMFDAYIDCYISISQATTEHIIRKVGAAPEKIRLLHNFVDLHRYSRHLMSDTDIAHFRNEHGVPSEAFVFGFAGRLIRMKGWREFVGAAGLVNKDYPAVHWLIAGDGADAPELTEAIQSNPNIHYIGYQSNMPLFYSTLDYFVIPSYWEAMGLTEIEAMAIQTPVLAADVPALNELIIDGKNGILFPAGSSRELADRMCRALNGEYDRDLLI